MSALLVTCGCWRCCIHLCSDGYAENPGSCCEEGALRKGLSLAQEAARVEAMTAADKAAELGLSPSTSGAGAQSQLALRPSSAPWADVLALGVGDYYQVLGVSGTASGDEIRRAYHRKALQDHPVRAVIPSLRPQPAVPGAGVM
jgi:hypothetical protein